MQYLFWALFAIWIFCFIEWLEALIKMFKMKKHNNTEQYYHYSLRMDKFALANCVIALMMNIVNLIMR